MLSSLLLFEGAGYKRNSPKQSIDYYRRLLLLDKQTSTSGKYFNQTSSILTSHVRLYTGNHCNEYFHNDKIEITLSNMLTAVVFIQKTI